jgi:hypothetical protein
MNWNDRATALTIEPGAPAGTTDVVRSRSFRVVLPDGRAKDVTYNGRRAAAAF